MLSDAQRALLSALNELTEGERKREMLARAERGDFDDFLSESATPIADLIREAKARGLFDIARRAMSGEFDGTSADAEAWANSEDGRRITAGLGRDN